MIKLNHVIDNKVAPNRAHNPLISLVKGIDETDAGLVSKSTIGSKLC